MAKIQAGSILRDIPEPLGAAIGRDTSDRQLLERFISQRDETAFVGLVQRHSRTVWSVCRRVLQHEQDAEDAFQAVFLVLARKAGSIQKKEAVGSWLYGVAYRTAMKARQLAARRQQRQKQVEEAKPAESASSEAALRELQRLLDEEVQRLSEKYRAPFVLCCLEGMSKAEAAKELDWKEGTVSGRLARARKLLQTRLARRGVLLSAALTAIALAQNSAAAAVPASLAQSTAAAALSSQAGAPAALSQAVIDLADAVMDTAVSTRLPVALALLLALLLVLFGTGLIALGLKFATEPPAPLLVADPDTFLPPPVGLGTPIDQQVAAVAFSPDGKRFVTAGGKREMLGQLKIWDTGTAKEVHAVSRIAGVRSMVFSPDETTLATGDSSGAITLRDPFTGIEQTRVTSHNGAVLGVAYSRDGKWLASVGADHKIKLWTADGLRERKAFDGHTAPVTAVAFFRQGLALVTASQDNTAKIWDLQTGKEKFTLTGHQAAVEAVAMSPDDRVVATASADQTVRLWDAETGVQTAVLEGNFGPFFAVAFSPDGAYLAVGGRDGMLRLWNAKTLQALGALDNHKEAIWALAFSKDGVLASGSADHTAKLWHIGDGKRPRTLSTSWSGIQPIQAVAYAPDGAQLAVATTDKAVHLRDAKSGDVLRVLAGHADIINCVVFSPDGAMLASGSNDETIKLWDRATGEEISTLTGHTGGVLALMFAADGKTLISAGTDKIIRLWNPATAKEINSLQGHDAPIHALAFAPDDRTFASGSADRTIKIWDLATLKESMTLKGHAGTVRAVTYSSAGALASGSEDGTVKLWNLSNGTERLSLEGHREVWTLAFTAQGRTLVSGGKDSTVRVWDPVSGALRGILKGHKAPVTALAIHPRGEHLVSGSHDTLLFRWQAGKFVAAADGPKTDEQFVAFQDGGRKEEPAPAKMPLIFRQDFRGQKIDEEFLKITPADAQDQIKAEPQGLRISLPGDNPKRQTAGVQTKFRLEGDFDIVLSYELLQADKPLNGNGIGVSLYVTTDSATKDAIQLRRFIRKDGGFYTCSKITTNAEGKRLLASSKVFPTEVRAGKLRLMRQGTTATFLVSDDGGAGFRELFQCDLGREDVAYVRAFGDPGDEESPPLVARLHDLEIRAQPAAVPIKNYAKEFYFDFRGKPLAEELTLVGQERDRFVKPGPEGLRITLPAERESVYPVGVGTRFSVQGDFEITATVEILHADVPEKGFGVGATLYINKVDPPTEGTNIGRMMRPKSDQIMWDRRYEKPGEKPTFAGNSQPCTDKIVRLRLQRTGSQLAYQWAVGASGGEFKRLAQNHFGADEVKQVMLRAATGQQPYHVDVRLIDLRVRSGGERQGKDAGAAVEPAANVAPGIAPPAGSKPWLIAGLLIGVLLLVALAGALGVGLYVRTRRQTAATAERAVVPAKKDKVEAAPPSLSLECPDCGKKLKVKPEMTGKKVKCVQCGKAVVVSQGPKGGVEQERRI